jgi:hypothetical protein
LVERRKERRETHAENAEDVEDVAENTAELCTQWEGTESPRSHKLKQRKFPCAADPRERRRKRDDLKL